MSTAATRIDYAPLSEKPTRAQAQSLRNEARAGAFGETTAARVRNSRRDGLLLTVVLGGFVIGIFGILAVVRAFQGDDSAVGFAVTGVVAAVVAAVYLVGSATARRSWGRTARLIAFARANGFAVQPVARPRTHPGTLFAHRSHASTHDLVSWHESGHLVETGRHLWSGGGARADNNDVAYLAVSLQAATPRLSFACGRRLRASVDLTLGVDVLAAEAAKRGPRPRLAAAAGDRARARTVFTDELIALLTDDAHPANAEVVGGWFLAYYGGGNDVDESWWRLRVRTATTVLQNVTALA